MPETRVVSGFRFFYLLWVLPFVLQAVTDSGLVGADIETTTEKTAQLFFSFGERAVVASRTVNLSKKERARGRLVQDLHYTFMNRTVSHFNRFR